MKRMRNLCSNLSTRESLFWSSCREKKNVRSKKNSICLVLFRFLCFVHHEPPLFSHFNYIFKKLIFFCNKFRQNFASLKFFFFNKWILNVPMNKIPFCIFFSFSFFCSSVSMFLNKKKLQFAVSILSFLFYTFSSSFF